MDVVARCRLRISLLRLGMHARMPRLAFATFSMHAPLPCAGPFAPRTRPLLCGLGQARNVTMYVLVQCSELAFLCLTRVHWDCVVLVAFCACIE